MCRECQYVREDDFFHEDNVMTKPLKVLDCFSGIGGFALAESFFEGQFETKQFVEINLLPTSIIKKF